MYRFTELALRKINTVEGCSLILPNYYGNNNNYIDTKYFSKINAVPDYL